MEQQLLGVEMHFHCIALSYQPCARHLGMSISFSLKQSRLRGSRWGPQICAGLPRSRGSSPGAWKSSLARGLSL